MIMQKENEINQLKQKIKTLETIVQIESLKTELANLKSLTQEKSKRKAKRKN